MPIAVVQTLSTYLKHPGPDPDPEYIGNVGAHLLGHSTDAVERAPALLAGRVADVYVGLAPSTLYRQLKRFFTECAEVMLQQGDAKGAGRFNAESSHWLRHTHASHAIVSGMPIEVAQQNLGHASLATTTTYLTTEAKRRLRAVEKF